MRYKDPVKSDNGNGKSSWMQSIFDKLNNSWMNHHGKSYNERKEDDYNEYGEVLTSQNGGNGGIHDKAKVTGNGFTIDDMALSSGGSPGVSTGVFKLKGINGGMPLRMQVNFSDLANAAQSFMGGMNDLRDYASGDKPLIRRVGPKTYFDTSKRFDYQKKLWHIRAKDGDTIDNAYDSDKTPVPNF